MSEAFDLIAFRDFCAGKGDEKFDACDGQLCAGYQFLKAQGEPIDWCGFYHWFDHQGGSHALPEGVCTLLIAAYGKDRMPFSALAARLSNLIGEGGNG